MIERIRNIRQDIFFPPIDFGRVLPVWSASSKWAKTSVFDVFPLEVSLLSLLKLLSGANSSAENPMAFV
jgi:hypothetical protein